MPTEDPGRPRLYDVTTAMSRYEQPTHVVVTEGDGYQVRYYQPYLVAETVVTGSFASSGNAAFRRLAGYIFGRNSANVRMNMTVPVTLRPSADGRYRYRFVMERSYTVETLPKPVDDRVRVVSVPAGHCAVRSYRGGRRERLFRRQEARLLGALAVDGIEVTGPAVLAVYSGPTTPPFLRRNEVIVPVADL